MEDATNATHLNTNMVDKALPHRLVANCTIACDGTTATVANKDNLTILLQVHGHRAILATNNIYAVRFLTAIISIIGKDQSTHAEFWTLSNRRSDNFE